VSLLVLSQKCKTFKKVVSFIFPLLTQNLYFFVFHNFSHKVSLIHRKFFKLTKHSIERTSKTSRLYIVHQYDEEYEEKGLFLVLFEILLIL